MTQADKEHVKCVYVIPFCDNDIEQLCDTIESVLYYTKETFKIVCVNDCKTEENKKILKNRYKQDEIISFIPNYDNSWPRNAYGPLFCKLYQAVEYSVNNLHFDYLIKMDTDALLTGGKLLDFADSYFSKNKSNVGILGSYKIRSDGQKRTHWEWALYLLYIVYFKKNLSRKSKLWSNCLPKAIKNKYSLGDSMLGGSYLWTYKCVSKMIRTFPYDTFSNDHLYETKIGEDVIFSLLAHASGFKIDDFGGPDDPMAIAQKSLPIAKEAVAKKQITHSIRRGIHGENEEELRAYFRSLRK